MVIYRGLSDDSHLCWRCWAEWKLVTMKDLPNLLWMTGNLYPVIHNITTVQMQHTSLLFIPLSHLFKHLWLIWRRVSQYPSHCLVAGGRVGGSLWHVETMNIRLKVRLQVSSCVCVCGGGVRCLAWWWWYIHPPTVGGSVPLGVWQRRYCIRADSSCTLNTDGESPQLLRHPECTHARMHDNVLVIKLLTNLS